MPFRKLALIIALAMVAAGITIGIGVVLATHYPMPAGSIAVLFPAVLVVFVIWRIRYSRLGTNGKD